MSRPRICLDTSMFRWRLTGIGYYGLSLAETLLDGAPDLDLVGYDGYDFAPLDAAVIEAVRGRNDRPTVSTRWRLMNRAFRLPGVRAVYRLGKRRRFAQGMSGADLFHAVNFAPPFAPTVPVLRTVHDISFLRHPKTHPADRVAWLHAALKGLDREPLVNTISEFSADEIAAGLGVERSRLRVTYPGVGPLFSPTDGPGDAGVLAGMGLASGRYLLAVGTVEPRKNLGTLLDAYAALEPGMRRDCPLLILGQPGWGRLEGGSVEALLAEGTLRLAGYRSEATLAVLYRHAATLLFPSIYEGFGMPTIEAMASGLVPVLSDIPVMREVAGDAAVYVAPRDVEGWREALRAAIGHAPSDAEKRRALGRAAAFRWDETGRRTAAIYREILALD